MKDKSFIPDRIAFAQAIRLDINSVMSGDRNKITLNEIDSFLNEHPGFLRRTENADIWALYSFMDDWVDAEYHDFPVVNRGKKSITLNEARKLVDNAVHQIENGGKIKEEIIINWPAPC